MSDKDQIKLSSMIGKGWAVVAEMITPMVVLGAAGWWLDKTFETKPWIFILLILIGFIVGFRNVYATVKRWL